MAKAEVTVDGQWVKLEMFFLQAQPELMKELRTAIKPVLNSARNEMRANVSGTVLNRVSGRLYRSVKASTRIINQTIVWGRAGSRWYIGRFWEGGMNRRGKAIPPRVWAGPAAKKAADEAAVIINQTLDRFMPK